MYIVQERTDVEWKFARSKLWISYFEEGGTVPPPFNIIPTYKSAWYLIHWLHRKLCGHSRAAKKEHMRTIRVSFSFRIKFKIFGRWRFLATPRANRKLHLKGIISYI